MLVILIILTAHHTANQYVNEATGTTKRIFFIYSSAL